MAWRHGLRVRPPLGKPDDDARYAALPPDAWPRGESLAERDRASSFPTGAT